MPGNKKLLIILILILALGVFTAAVFGRGYFGASRGGEAEKSHEDPLLTTEEAALLMRKIDHLLDESQKKNKVHEADEILHLEMQNQDEGRVLLSKSKNNTKDVANQEDKGEKVQGRGGIIQGLGRSGGEYYRPYYSGLEESGLQNGMIAAQGQIMLRGQSAQKGERLAAESKSTVYIVSKESRSQSLSSQLSSSEKALVQSAKVIPSPVSEFSSQGGNIFPSSGKESENNKDQSVNQDVNKVNNDNEGGDEDTSESAATTPFTFNFWGHVNAAPGSWVSVYDSKNNFLKKARVRDDGTYFLKIDMDDAGTPEREGMRIGDPLIFRVGEKIAEPVPPAKGVCQGDGLNLTQLDLRVES